MEQYEDIKSELQQELHDLQQNVEQHSTFNNNAWRETVKQSSNALYWLNAFHAGVVVIVMIGVTIAFNVIKWPWWLILLFDLYFGWILADNLFAIIGLRKADVQSREGLLSLRENLNAYSKRRRTIIQVVGIILLLVLEVCLFFYDRWSFFAMIIWGTLLSGPFGLKRTLEVTKRYDKLSEEIDELLKE
ncbi:MAG: hypothetical protein IJK85_02860 [Bacteroidales bacterium]|nr:hypothetical protein [Bacteroidales bacterium]